MQDLPQRPHEFGIGHRRWRSGIVNTAPGTATDSFRKNPQEIPQMNPAHVLAPIARGSA
jgi:hypothetical protein